MYNNRPKRASIALLVDKAQTTHFLFAQLAKKFEPDLPLTIKSLQPKFKQYWIIEW